MQPESVMLNRKWLGLVRRCISAYFAPHEVTMWARLSDIEDGAIIVYERGSTRLGVLLRVPQLESLERPAVEIANAIRHTIFLSLEDQWMMRAVEAKAQ